MKKFKVKHITKSMMMTTELKNDSLDSLADYIKTTINAANLIDGLLSEKVAEGCELEIKDDVYQFSFYRMEDDDEVFMTFPVKKGIKELKEFLNNTVGKIGMYYYNQAKFEIEIN
ncbi:hypothetical protein [Aquitalea pelogenes]|uniref:hypothetical protein n=1 Tax=Aquitalea pelogenes TaxID=1293573 RepID=UPI0035B3FE5B